MKASTFLLLATAAAVGMTAWTALRKKDTLPLLPPPDPSSLHEGTMALKTDDADVFRRAFWRRPDAADRILHAERREWTKDSSAGVAFWQWFVAVEPGPSLTKWLREENAFGVRPAKSADINGAPAWFPGDTADYEIHTGGNGGGLVFLFGRDGKTLYATGSGRGFTPGAPERPSPEASQAAATGRLPLTPPPIPPKP
jgi:hypothetical protein